MANKKSAESKPMPQAKHALENKANGTMDYISKQDAMASKDTAKLKSGSYKDGRYE